MGDKSKFQKARFYRAYAFDAGMWIALPACLITLRLRGDIKVALEHATQSRAEAGLTSATRHPVVEARSHGFDESPFTLNDLERVHMAELQGTAQKRNMVTGMFRDRDSAERAYAALPSRGYTERDINLAMSEDTRRRHFGDGATTELGNKAAEGAGVGGAIGATVGAIAAAVAAVGSSLVIPGLGLVIAGPAAAALAGAGAGGLTGGIIGALVGWGIPEERVKHYEAGIKEGGIVMGVTPRSDEDAEYIEREWKNSKGEHVYR